MVAMAVKDQSEVVQVAREVVRKYESQLSELNQKVPSIH